MARRQRKGRSWRDALSHIPKWAWNIMAAIWTTLIVGILIQSATVLFQTGGSGNILDTLKNSLVGNAIIWFYQPGYKIIKITLIIVLVSLIIISPIAAMLKQIAESIEQNTRQEASDDLDGHLYNIPLKLDLIRAQLELLNEQSTQQTKQLILLIAQLSGQSEQQPQQIKQLNKQSEKLIAQLKKQSEQQTQPMEPQMKMQSTLSEVEPDPDSLQQVPLSSIPPTAHTGSHQEQDSQQLNSSIPPYATGYQQNKPRSQQEPTTGPIPASEPTTGPIPASELTTGPVPTSELTTGPIPASEPTTGLVPASEPTTGPVPASEPLKETEDLAPVTATKSIGRIDNSRGYIIRPVRLIKESEKC